MKKAFAIFLYLLWGTCLTLILTFTTEIGSGITKFFRMFIDSQTNDVKISDIIFDLEEEYIVGKSYHLEYTVIGDYDTDPGLIFTSMDVGTLSVSSLGNFVGVRKAHVNEYIARIKVTSKYDLHFSKIIELKFVKKYPDKITLNGVFKCYGGNAKTAYLGIPVHIYFSVPNGVTYSELDFEVIYDSNYLEKIYQNTTGVTFMPVNNTTSSEKTTVTFRLGNGLTENYSFPIMEPKIAEDFNDITTWMTNVGYTNLDEVEFQVNRSYYIYIRKENKSVYDNFEISIEDETIATNPYLSILSFKKPGKTKVTIKLSNGFTKDITVNCVSHLYLPEIKDLVYKDDKVVMKESLKHTYQYSFPSNATKKTFSLEFDKTKLAIYTDSKHIYVTPKTNGELSFRVIVDDGFERVEKTYNLLVEKNKVSGTTTTNLSTFVFKVLGHMGVFAILSIFTLNMFRYFNFKSKIRRFISYTCCAVFFGCLTEFIQSFYPNRNPAIKDIFIDLTGFYLGTIAFKALNKHLIKRRNKMKQKEEMILNARTNE